MLGGCARGRIVDQAHIGNVVKGGPGEQRRKIEVLRTLNPRRILLGPILRDALHRYTTEGLAVEQMQDAARRSTAGARLFQYRLEDRLELTRRGIDDLLYLGRRGLLLQQLALFSQQPRVLDCDDRLIGKGRNQFDLPLGVRLNPLPIKRDNADWLAVARERDPKDGAYPGRHSLGQRIVRVSDDVRDMHDPTFERHPPGDGLSRPGTMVRWRKAAQWSGSTAEADT